MFEIDTLTAITSKLDGIGIERQGKLLVIAIRTPLPRDSLSFQKIVNLEGRISLS